MKIYVLNKINISPLEKNEDQVIFSIVKATMK